ncbi:MAG: glycosyltransferase family 2 protein, partial [Planctomycetaceae bacterium]
MPEVSVVLPVFNGARTIANSVQSILDQTLRNIELIVVDDGSTDNTGALLGRLAAELDRVHVVTHPENRGIGEAVHTGYGAVTKDWVCILPADGQITMAEYRKLIPTAQSGADFVLGRYGQRRGQVDARHRVILSGGLRLFMWMLLGVGQKIDSAFLFRRNILDDVALTSRSFFVNLELP